jgi:hypothetical protein
VVARRREEPALADLDGGFHFGLSRGRKPPISRRSASETTSPIATARRSSPLLE